MSVVFLPVYSCSFYAPAKVSVNEELVVIFFSTGANLSKSVKKGHEYIKKM